MRGSVRYMGVAATVWVFGACLTGVRAQQPGEIKLEERSFTTGSDERITYELGTLYVPENRSVNESRLIGVGFARFKATTQPPKAPPVFVLPGGPGGSYVRALTSSNPVQRSIMLDRRLGYRRFADLVFVDQRGFSTRGDELYATFRFPPLDPETPRTVAIFEEAFKTFARDTISEYEQKKIDLRGYTVKECAHDVHDLSKALGYDQITLEGTSFGSQWSFAIMRLHPELVARAVLSGVEPLDHGYDMPSHVFAAVRRMWRVIDQDPGFKPYLPEGGMAEAARVVIQRLEREPMPLQGKDQKSGQKQTIATLGTADFPWNDPVRILELYHGRTQRFVVQATMQRLVTQRQLRLIGPLIDSSLGVTPERRYQLETDPATRYLSRRNFAPYLASADLWPSPDVGDDFRRPVRCDTPVVFAHGDWDTQTPIENALEILPYFPNSHLIIGERGGHGILGPLAQQQPKVWQQVEEFVRTGDRKEIPTRVRLEPSRQFTPPKFSPKTP